MAVRPPFDAPASSRRPHGAFRFDVVSLKAKRRITLYGHAALKGWLELESDPGIEQLCERPLVVPDSKPQRVVDFWATGPGRNELIFLLRQSELSGSGRKPFSAGFETWAGEVGCAIRRIPIEPPTPAKERWVGDWTEVLQTVAAYQSLVPSVTLEKLKTFFSMRRSLAEATRTIEADGEIVRAGAYLLVYRGTHRFANIDTEGLDGDLQIEPV